MATWASRRGTNALISCLINTVAQKLELAIASCISWDLSRQCHPIDPIGSSRIQNANVSITQKFGLCIQTLPLSVSFGAVAVDETSIEEHRGCSAVHLEFPGARCKKFWPTGTNFFHSGQVHCYLHGGNTVVTRVCMSHMYVECHRSTPYSWLGWEKMMYNHHFKSRGTWCSEILGSCGEEGTTLLYILLLSIIGVVQQ